MSQIKTPAPLRLFEAATLLTMALTALSFVGLMAYAEARHRGLL